VETDNTVAGYYEIGYINRLMKRIKARRLPRTAAWGRFIMGVPYNEPNTPPLELLIGESRVSLV